MDNSSKLSRRVFLSAVASAAAASRLSLTGATMLANDPAPALAAEDSHIRASRESTAPPPLVFVNPGYRLTIDPATGSIVSFVSTYGLDREFLIPNHNRLPLFKIELLDEHAVFTTVTSLDAKEVRIGRSDDDAAQNITIDYRSIGNLPLDARVKIRLPRSGTLTYWSLEWSNRTNLWIGHAQFPVIQAPFDNPINGGFSHILSSSLDGALSGPVEPSMSLGVYGGGQRNTPEVWRYSNYPGQGASTQMMAYYNDAGGLYMACEDAAGLPKFIQPLLEDSGVTMGIGHYPGTRGPDETKLPYNIVLGTFHGDWYSAAQIYRDWAEKQPFCATKLADRSDCPKWLTDSAVGIMFPMRGQADWDGPATVNPEYTPATNALPYLEKLAGALESPLMPIVFNWEHGGPWVQPDAFPPIGGEAAMREFMAKAKERGWHPVIYGDGLCWVVWQKNTDYDGMAYFHAHGGESAVARRWDGELLQDVWPWRRNYVVCVGAQGGRQMVVDMTRRMAELGPDVIQQFDQGPGPRACYATDHGHPPVPGPWMTKAFDSLIKRDIEAARSFNPAVAMSCEGAPPETWLQDFQIWDARIRNCPLFSFLYHEYINGHEGLYTNRISDEALRLSVAKALVTGYMINFTLRDKGRIAYDWDQPWTRAIPDQGAILDWANRTHQFRTGIARDYLVYGRMLRPWKVSNVAERDFGLGKEPGVQSATWRAQDGRIGVVLANYADLGVSPQIELEGEGTRHLSLYIDGRESAREVELPSAIDIDLLPRSLCLIQVR